MSVVNIFEINQNLKTLTQKCYLSPTLLNQDVIAVMT